MEDLHTETYKTLMKKFFKDTDKKEHFAQPANTGSSRFAQKTNDGKEQ